MSLYQFQHVLEDGSVGFMAQREFDERRTTEEFQAWVRGLRATHELPARGKCRVCTEKSGDFLLMADVPEGERV